MKNLDQFLQKMETGVARVISEKDEMFRYARAALPSDTEATAYYLDTGRELATGLLKGLLASGIDPASVDLLDFAAGYGRVSRWLAPVLRSVTVADLEQDMLDFQRQVIGVEGYCSSTSPDAPVAGGRTFDVVFAFSLFTHLPDASWLPWLGALSAALRPGGRLVFSTHSYELFALLNPAEYADRGNWYREFVFWAGNETGGRLDASGYGSNITSESYVRRRIAETAGINGARRFPMGEFDRYHDIYVATIG
jgi:2-polyprenyl-3-methyl-5-hydroxy-6-metoxy-1,4-benzoquinol methylase